MNFNDVAKGMTLEELQAITNRHPTTLRKYRRTNQAPAAIVRLIAVYRTGKLPSTDSAWTGWRIAGPVLIDPDGNEYSPGEIRSIWATKQLQKELERMKCAPVQFLMDL